MGLKGGEMMENEQATLENQEEYIIPPVYGFVTAETHNQLIEKLNKRAVDGYRPIWDKLEECEQEGGFRIPVYNHDILPKTIREVDPVELEIIDAQDKAVDYFIQCNRSLTDEKNRLLIDTDYNIVNAKRQALDEPLPAINTAPEKKAWAELQVSKRIKDMEDAKRWKDYVEARAKKHQLPDRESPWEEKARLKEEEMRLNDEKASQVNAEKVQNPPVKEEG